MTYEVDVSAVDSPIAQESTSGTIIRGKLTISYPLRFDITMSGVEWVALTDGDEWRIYNSHALVPIEKKLFRIVRVSDESTFPEETLRLLAKDEIEEKQISRMWAVHFVDRQLEAAIRELFAADPDSGLLRLLRRKLTRVKPKDPRE